jgi:hypothetical protein
MSGTSSTLSEEEKLDFIANISMKIREKYRNR